MHCEDLTEVTNGRLGDYATCAGRVSCTLDHADYVSRHVRRHNPDTVFPPYSNYAHAVEVPPGARTLYISGLNGYDPTGVDLPASFEGQIENVWSHIGAILDSAGMTYADLVSLRFYLTSADYDPANVASIRAHLRDNLAARTVVVQQLLDPAWLVEVEAIAARVE